MLHGIAKRVLTAQQRRLPTQLTFVVVLCCAVLWHAVLWHAVCCRLSVLWGHITPEYKRFGQFLTGTQHNRRQVCAV
jgi:hypothetical protein